MPLRSRAAGLLLALWSLGVPTAGTGAAELFTDGERAIILSHGPWPPPPVRDSSNAVSGNPAAIAFGRRLFQEHRLSSNKRMSCASCHLPHRAFTDGQTVSTGQGAIHRNAPSVLNTGLMRWLGWDGASDSLWAASLRPILMPAEMNLDLAGIARFIRADSRHASDYEIVFGRLALAEADERLAVNIAKAMAAWQETLITPRTEFDRFRDALARGDAGGMAAYPPAAKRGLKLFVGEGRCSVCHFGPLFSSGEFESTGLPHFRTDGSVDPGRHGGIQSLKRSRYTRHGPFSDDPDGPAALLSAQVAVRHRNWGAFKVPSLRNVAATAPYMHDGSLPDLPAVIRHYSELDPSRLHADGERILRPLRLDPVAADDLVRFLETLSGSPPETVSGG